MSTRPTFIDLRSESYDTMRSGFPSERGHQSPRMQHFAGDIPPAMSPLDMFAAQSRLLAKQLDDSKRNGRRVSRLPPLTTGDPITKQKSIYQRSRSAEANNVSSGSSPRTRDEDQPGTIPGLEEPDFRPKSFYPRMSNVPPFEDDTGYVAEPSPERSFLTPAEFQQARPVQDYFAIPSAAEPVLPAGRGAEKMDRRPWVYHPRNPDNSYQNELQRGKSMESTSSRGHNGSLAPPKSPHVRHAGSIRSIPQDSSDDELSASTGGSGFSQHRKLSSSSGVSMPQSPLSPFAQAHRRSPSLNSEYSIGGSRQARPAFNFSRPLSRASRPSFEVTSRQPSFDSRPSTDVVRPPFNSGSRQPSADSQRMMFMDDTVQTPVSMVNEQLPESKEHPGAPAPSYIYTKFSLPRGRMLQRNSKVLRGDQMPLFDWERPVIPSNVRPSTPLAQRPMTPTESPRLSADRPSGETPRPLVEQASRVSPRPSTEHICHEGTRPPPDPVQIDAQSQISTSTAASTRSGSTIKARPRAPAPSMELTAEDHLAKGIELHERGAARESTYHLRIAAKQNLPTAMLLYALACRHGWGMRPNQQEGVQWLRKAADCASLEIAIDEDANANPADLPERKTRRAQFALSIYELGVSHMNGWGIEQDKTLALRCFEIAGDWGDADAMAEAGFCYAQGQGCKKDLKKAAKYYRMAEAKGMSMVGNSWIYKPKYADETDGKERQGRGVKQTAVKQTTPEKKSRDKSRARTIFGRKKSISQRP